MTVECFLPSEYLYLNVIFTTRMSKMRLSRMAGQSRTIHSGFNIRETHFLLTLGRRNPLPRSSGHGKLWLK